MAAGSIVVDLLMKTGSFETDTKRAEKRSREMAREIDKVFKMVSIAVAAAGAAFVAMTKSVINSADEVAKASRSIGITTESLSALQFAAKLSGVSSNELNQSLIRLNKSAADGNKAFNAMGISVRDAEGNLKATDTLLKEVSDKFSGYADGAEKSALAQEIFGRSGAQMISMLNEGSEGLSRMEAEAQRLGIVISGDLAKNAEALNDNLSKIALAAKGAAIQIAGPLIKSLADLTNGMFEAHQQGSGFVDMLHHGFRRLSQAKTIEDARRQVNELEEAMHRMSVADFHDDLNTSFAKLQQNLDFARQRLHELLTEQSEESIKPLVALGTAPIVADQAAVKKELDATKKEREAYDEWMRSMQESENRFRLDMIDKRIAAEKQAEIDYQAWMDGMRDGELQQYLKMQDLKEQRLQEATEKLKSFADDMGMAFSNAFENAILTGKKLSDTLRDLAQDILRLIFRQTISGPIADAISGAIVGGFGGAQATGGDVMRNRSYLVGENGPEMFVPRTAGTIVPNTSMGGPTVNQTINVTTGVQQTVRAEILTLMPQIANAAKAAVSDAKLRGGSYSAALR